MVVNIQWLSTLGSNKWDFTNPFMEFTMDGQKLKGNSSSKLRVVEGEPNNKLLESGA